MLRHTLRKIFFDKEIGRRFYVIKNNDWDSYVNNINAIKSRQFNNSDTIDVKKLNQDIKSFNNDIESLKMDILKLHSRINLLTNIVNIISVNTHVKNVVEVKFVDKNQKP